MFPLRLMRVWSAAISRPPRRRCSTWPHSGCSTSTETWRVRRGAWAACIRWAASAPASCTPPKWVGRAGWELPAWAQEVTRSRGEGPASWTARWGAASRPARWRSSVRRSRCWRCLLRRKCQPRLPASWRSGTVYRGCLNIRPCSATWPLSKSGPDMDLRSSMSRWGSVQDAEKQNSSKHTKSPNIKIKTWCEY